MPDPDAAIRAPPARIVTIAGQNGAPGQFADGIGGAARFDGPEGLVLDPAGHALFIADSNNHALRRLDLTTMEVTTVAGIGRTRGSNDSGSGSPPRFHTPRNLALDASGTGIYVTDTGNFTIRHVALSAYGVTTVAGRAGEAGTTDGAGPSARFGNDSLFAPWAGAMVLDARTASAPVLYIADSGNQTVRALDIVTGVVSTVAGAKRVAGAANGIGTAALFNKPTGLALDGRGGVYVAEANNLDVRRIDSITNVVTTVAGKAPPDPSQFCENISPVLPPECGATDAAIGTDARFRFPFDLEPDGAGGVFLVDSHNNLIRHLDLTSSEVTTVAGVQTTVLDDLPHESADTTESSPGTFWHPTHVVFSPPNILYVSDRSTNSIRRVELGVE